MAHETVNCHPLENTATTNIARDDLLRFIRAYGPRAEDRQARRRRRGLARAASDHHLCDKQLLGLAADEHRAGTTRRTLWIWEH